MWFRRYSAPVNKASFLPPHNAFPAGYHYLHSACRLMSHSGAALYPLSLNYFNLLVALDWIHPWPSSHRRGISLHPTLIPLWHLAAGCRRSFLVRAAKCRRPTKFSTCLHSLTYELSFMVQFIWHLIRCTTTSEKIKKKSKAPHTHPQWSFFLLLSKDNEM